MGKKFSDIKPGGVIEYIAKCPKEVRPLLKELRAIIKKTAPKAMETVSYFQFPGYCYGEGYVYNGMFAWFSYKAPFVRLHVWPEVLKTYKKELAGYKTQTAVVFFPPESKIPSALVKKLVKESIKVLKSGPKTRK